MRENVSLITTRVIQIGLVALAFLLPVFFVPTTSEFYNFNKTTLLTIGVAILFLLWGAKMVAEQRVRITRTPLDVPLLIFLIIYILATVFSLDPNVSLLGWHPVFFGSLPSVAAVVILYFLATTHLDSTYRTWVTYALVASASLLAVAGIAGFIGQPLFSANWAQARNWTAAGDLNKLAFFLAMAIPLTISAALFVKETPYRYLFYVLAGVQIVSFVLINSIPAYIVIAAGLFFVLLLSPKVEIKSEIRTALGILGAVAVAVLLVVNVKGLADNILKPFIISEDKATTITKPITLPLSAAWQTSARAVAERPVFGYGPATYGLIFPSFKPVTLNQVNTNNLWNIRFDEPSSGILNLLATTGVAGTIAFVLVVIFLIRSLISFSAGSNLIRSNTHILFLQGSLVAFLIGQVVDVTVFHFLRAYTGSSKIWLRATGSTLVSQFIDSFVVLFIAFYIGAGWDLKLVLAIGVVNYFYKFFVAVFLTPLLYVLHYFIDFYLGKELSEQLIEEAAQSSRLK